MKKIIKILSILCITLLVGTIASQTVNAQNEREKQERMDVIFQADDRYKNPSGNNLADDEDVRTEKDIWENDTGEVPEGVLVGNLLEPSLYELDYQPQWRNEFHHGENTAVGKYGYTNIAQTVEVSSSKIMNGASEYWIQVPVHSDSIESLRLRHDDDTIEDVVDNYLHSSIAVFEGDYSNADVHTRFDDCIDAPRTYYVEDGSEIKPEAVVPITENNKHGDRPYVKMNMFFESDTTYTFVYNIISGGNKPRIFTTSSENFGKTSIQYGASSIQAIGVRADVGSYQALSYSYGDPEFPLPEKWHKYSYVETASNMFEENEDTPMKLATSFVFTRGMGDRNLFGHELKINAGEILHFYPDFNFSNYDSDSDVNAISMYMPFISERDLGNDVDISIGVAGPNLDNRYGIEEDYKIWNWEYIEWDFNQFILYSDSTNWEHIDEGLEGYGDGITVFIKFEEDVDLTLLMSGRDAHYDETSTNSMRRWNGANMRLTGKDFPFYLLISDEDPYIERHELFFTMPKLDASITQDWWAQVNSTGDGLESYSHAFHIAEYYSNITYDMVDEEGKRVIINIVTDEKPDDHLHSPWHYGEEFLRAGYDWQIEQTVKIATWFVGEGGGSGAEGGDTWLLERIRDIMKDSVNSLWEGVQDVYGSIRDAVFWVYERIIEGLRVIYDAIMDFVDWIVGVLEDAWEILGVLTERISYIIGMLGFVFATGAVSKVIKLSDWNMIGGK